MLHARVSFLAYLQKEPRLLTSQASLNISANQSCFTQEGKLTGLENYDSLSLTDSQTSWRGLNLSTEHGNGAEQVKNLILLVTVDHHSRGQGGRA